MPHLLFASQHALPDVASGAAVSLVELLDGLRGQSDFPTTAAAITGAEFDSQPEPAVALRRAGFTAPPTTQDIAGIPAKVHRCLHHGIPCLIADSGYRGLTPGPKDAWPFIALMDAYLRRTADSGQRVDAVVFYGGGWAGRAIQLVARRHGVPSILWLRNHNYARSDFFSHVAATLVPSHFTAEHYRKTVGYHALVAPSPVSAERAMLDAASHRRRFVTFISPIAEKGLYMLARIASELGRLRPDIELLIVLGRGNAANLSLPGLDLRSRPNVHVLPPTADPKAFLSQTKVMLVPSVWDETFFRTGIEAAMNGIPSIVSERGALAEVIGPAGEVIPLPAWMGVASTRTPTPAEARPWVDAIAKCFDDLPHYQRLCDRALDRSQQYGLKRALELHVTALRTAIANPPAPAGRDIPLGEYLAQLDPLILPAEMHGLSRSLGHVQAADGLFDDAAFEPPALPGPTHESGPILTLDQYLTSTGQ
jgi:glycosyltransferase involved in cell wall biosynthesis